MADTNLGFGELIIIPKKVYLDKFAEVPFEDWSLVNSEAVHMIEINDWELNEDNDWGLIEDSEVSEVSIDLEMEREVYNMMNECDDVSVHRQIAV